MFGSGCWQTGDIVQQTFSWRCLGFLKNPEVFAEELKTLFWV